MSDNKKSVDSTRIKQLREKFRLTQEELAEKLDVSSKTILRYEGKGIPKSKKEKMVPKLSEIFNVPGEYITGETDIESIALYIQYVEDAIPEDSEATERHKMEQSLKSVLCATGYSFIEKWAQFDFQDVANARPLIRGPYKIIPPENSEVYITEDEAKELIEFLKQMIEMKILQIQAKARRENGNS